ncbi:MAG: cell division protein SepF [bacterium]|nr:cell division protein SepF [bacterium]
MSKIGSFFKKMFGIVDEEEDLFETDPDKKVHRIFSVSGKEKETVTVFIYGLNNYDEVRRVIDEVKAGKIVVVNFESADRSEAIRALDFVSGAVYALEGSLQKVGDYVFLAVPRGVEVEDSTSGQAFYPPGNPRNVI